MSKENAFPNKRDFILLGAAAILSLSGGDTKSPVSPNKPPETVPTPQRQVRPEPTLAPAKMAVRRSCADINSQKGQLRSPYADCDKDGNLIDWGKQ